MSVFARQSYCVIPLRAGGWAVRRKYASQPKKIFPDKDAAIEGAKKLANSAGGRGRVIVYRIEGGIESELYG